MIEKKDLVEIGQFQRTHALKGELNAILSIDEDYVADGNPLIVETEGIPVPYYAETIRPKGATSYLIKLQGLDSAEEAAEMVNLAIYAPKELLADYVGDVMFDDDIVGFEVVDKHLGNIGKLKYIDSATENELLVVERPDGEEVYIPLVDEFVEEIDEEGKMILTNLPEGLVEINA